MAFSGAGKSRLVYARTDDTSTVDLDAEANAPRLVIGIDFGTFASGYALQWRSDFKKDRMKIKVNTKWDAEGFCTNKTLTCLLLDPDQNRVAFGYSAEKMYAEMGIEDRNKHFLFRYFKMALYHRENLNDRTPIESVNGTPLPAIDVFTHSIAFMKESVLEYLSDSGVLFPEDETTWVLTVPAIWDDMAKGIMRRAASKAGIKDERLSIALEPEAAAIYCSLLPTDQLTGKDRAGKPIYVADPGSKLMITDLGGGTVDITSVEVNQDGTMRQLCRAGGGAWGGRKVNIKFTLLMKDLVGEHVYTKFSIDYPEEEYDFQMRFESNKRNVKTLKSPRHGKDEFGIKLPSKLKKVWENNTGSKTNVKDLLNRGPFKDKVNFRAGSLFFHLDLIRELFDEPVEEIISYTKRLLNKLDEQLTAMLLVGGFAESSYVVTKVREGLSEMNVPVVRPEQTEIAVMCGAVLFGQNESIMTSRIAQATYGVGMNMEFVKGKHREELSYKDGTKTYVTNVFRKHVTVDDEVRLGQWISLKEYWPEYESQTKAIVYIFASDQKDPVHTDDKGSKFIGDFEIEFTDPPKVEGRVKGKKAVEVAMNFGGTELKIRATDKASGKIIYKYMRPHHGVG